MELSAQGREQLRERWVYWTYEYRQLQRAEQIDRRLAGCLGAWLTLFIGPRWSEGRRREWVRQKVETDFQTGLLLKMYELSVADLGRLTDEWELELERSP